MKNSPVKAGEFFVQVFLSLRVREEVIEEPGKQHGVKIDHDDQSDSAGNERPQLIAIVTRHAAAKVIGYLLMPFYERNARCQDKQPYKK